MTSEPETVSPVAGQDAGIATHTGLAMAVVMTGVLITAVDTTIVVLALPEISGRCTSRSPRWSGS